MPITIRGKDALFAKLRAMVPATETAVTEANRQSAEEMVATAKSFAPVKTGALRNSIRMEPAGPPGSFKVMAGGAATTKRGRGGRGGAFDYSLGVEYGTAPHVNQGEFAGSENPGARREPFFWPAYRLIRKKMRSRASSAIRRAIRGAIGK